MAKARDDDKRYVRLKPYNPRRGFVTRKYTHVPSKMKFEETHGWYVVDVGLANHLATLHQNLRDELTPPMFDVCTKAQAEQLMAIERKEKVRKDPHEANDLTTADLRNSSLGKLDRNDSTGSPVDERRALSAKRVERAAKRAGAKPRAERSVRAAAEHES